MKIQINNLGRDFVNKVGKVLHNIIDTKQRIIPNQTGFVNDKSRTIK